MLKFFRKYNTIILVGGGVLLMVVFLVQPAVSIFMPTGAGRTVAELDGEPVTLGEERQAAGEMQLLERLSGLFALELGDEPLRWVKLKRRAAALGLSASDAEVGQLLSSLNVTPETVASLATRAGTTPDTVYEAVRHYLAVARYRQLAAGDAGRAPAERLFMLDQAARAEQQTAPLARAGDPRATQLYQQIALIYRGSEGHQRLSTPAVRHAIRDIASRVGGRLILLDAGSRVDDAPEPSETRLAELFEQYKDDVPGRGEPYGFGYLIPDRAKLEWLRFDAEEVRASVAVDEAEAVARYRENPALYERPEDPTDEPAGAFASSEARERVVSALREEKTREKLERLTETAVNALRQPLRPLRVEGGYRVLPEGFAPPPLEDVANRLEDALGIRPRVRPADESWRSMVEPETLTPLGRTVLADRRPAVPFAAYVMSAKEFDPAPENPLVPLRLQVGSPSEPMESVTGDAWYVFRLADAEPGRVPGSLDAVREQVAADARLLSAYEVLVEEASSWQTRAAAEGLNGLMNDGGRLVPVPLAPRLVGREPTEDPRTDPALIDAMFDLAGAVAEAYGPGAVADAPLADRLTTAPLPRLLSLAVFELESYQPVTKSRFAQARRQPLMPVQATALLEAERPGASGPWLWQLDVGPTGDETDDAPPVDGDAG